MRGGSSFTRTPATLVLRDVAVAPDESLEMLTPFVPPSVPDPDAIIVEAKGFFYPFLHCFAVPRIPPPPECFLSSLRRSLLARDPERGGSAARRLQRPGGHMRAEPVLRRRGAGGIRRGSFDGAGWRGGPEVQHRADRADPGRGGRVAAPAEQAGPPPQLVWDPAC